MTFAKVAKFEKLARDIELFRGFDHVVLKLQVLLQGRRVGVTRMVCEVGLQLELLLMLELKHLLDD